MINYHPTDFQLRCFVDGQCHPALSLMIAAHCDMCSECREKVARYEAQSARLALMQSDDEGVDWSNMLSNITDLPAQQASEQIELQATTVELDGRHFELPPTLRRYATKTNSWSKVPGGIWQAPIELGVDGKAHFIYLEKGAKVPEHTHKGNELSLVIQGDFADGVNEYDSGDLIQLNNEHIHAPYTDSDEGCLVFAFVDQPLHFTSGVAKLLNPFSQLFF